MLSIKSGTISEGYPKRDLCKSIITPHWNPDRFQTSSLIFITDKLTRIKNKIKITPKNNKGRRAEL